MYFVWHKWTIKCSLYPLWVKQIDNQARKEYFARRFTIYWSRNLSHKWENKRLSSFLTSTPAKKVSYLQRVEAAEVGQRPEAEFPNHTIVKKLENAAF